MSKSLVSVIISAYNSSQYIIETLESVSKQTWREIELIITDDCSTDHTVDLCKKWVAENGDIYAASTLIRSNNNTGISANANRGLRAAKGEWIKFLGADDTLKPNCIEDNMSFVNSRSGVKVIFSQIDVYKDTFESQNFLQTTPVDLNNSLGIISPGRSADSQYKMLLLCDRIHFSPSVFLNRETLLSLGGFDERFRLLEDYPLWLNLTRSGHKLYFMDKITVNYRRHSKAINNTGNSYLINPNYFRSEEFRRIYTYPYLPFDIRLLQRYNWYMSKVFKINLFNKDNQPFRMLHSILTIWLNPFKYIIWLRKKVNKKLMKNEFYM